MDFEDLEHLAAFFYIMYKWYTAWRNEKRSKDKGQKPRKQKPKSKKRNRR